ncbi:putative 37S ribosomal protein mrp2, mitochondrial [Zancudomyces culisetae]|uniref:Putative 37S ribosomal protein mrp2, mitochondrial n=1 Tax=Zancudomyces culisetae TaxID=1213189 RepID=A0A1R1PH83_ZANCU|nr:putative 37S ribosomal protein mrp2, mitochondrial [Zancudomyces culisetae]OMH80336.1 putative 37S ribosomal protein mrp2, mitochondrial [Zancudomyces culisetae]OMH82424.1 putative 37S ribosomal protein mrp2, mitochondrial [Zancudomyces culisetae]|eukprot:OMH79254.1 putative 37S ribosomal protein mrp2, mitochondrial [Zancudomyces culisetae]
MGILDFNARTLRSIKSRQLIQKSETERLIYRYINRNPQNSTRVRMQAMFALTENFPHSANPTFTKNRCVETGRGRGVMSDWKLCRFQFRLKALRGDLPGVQKSSW